MTRRQFQAPRVVDWRACEVGGLESLCVAGCLRVLSVARWEGLNEQRLCRDDHLQNAHRLRVNHDSRTSTVTVSAKLQLKTRQEVLRDSVALG